MPADAVELEKRGERIYKVLDDVDRLGLAEPIVFKRPGHDVQIVHDVRTGVRRDVEVHPVRVIGLAGPEVETIGFVYQGVTASLQGSIAPMHRAGSLRTSRPRI